MNDKVDLAVIKARVPKSLKDFVISECSVNGVSMRTFMIYLIKRYRAHLIQNGNTVIEDVLSFTCEDNTEVEINFQIDVDDKRDFKVTAAKNKVSDKLFVIGSIKRYKNDNESIEESELDDLKII